MRLPDEMRRGLEALDLECIQIKLMTNEHGKQWSKAKTERIAKIYKNFLFLAATQSEPVVPTLEVDEFWHQHILDTHKYADDCMRIFGRFIHHFPYYGLRGEKDKENLEASFARTRDLYRETFGEEYMASKPMKDKHGECGIGGNCSIMCNACGSVKPQEMQGCTDTITCEEAEQQAGATECGTGCACMDCQTESFTSERPSFADLEAVA